MEDDLPFVLYEDQLTALNQGMPLNRKALLEQKTIDLGNEKKQITWKDVIDCENGVLPFLSFSANENGDEENGMEAERNLDIFTQEVLMPLCVKTNAIVICTPTKTCSLGMSFGKAASFLAPTFGYYSFQILYIGPWDH